MAPLSSTADDQDHACLAVYLAFQPGLWQLWTQKCTELSSIPSDVPWPALACHPDNTCHGYSLSRGVYEPRNHRRDAVGECFLSFSHSPKVIRRLYSTRITFFVQHPWLLLPNYFYIWPVDGKWLITIFIFHFQRLLMLCVSAYPENVSVNVNRNQNCGQYSTSNMTNLCKITPLWPFYDP